MRATLARLKTASLAFALLCVSCHGASASAPTGESIVSDPDRSAVIASAAPSASSNAPIATDLVDASTAVSSTTNAVLGPCGPTKITVDGKPMSIVSARAYGFDSLLDVYTIVLSDKTVSCKDLIKGARALGRGETYVEVSVGPDSAQQYLSSGNTVVTVSTDVVRAPKSAGDTIEICVRDPGELVPAIGPQKTIAVSGLVKGTYCGNVKK